MTALQQSLSFLHDPLHSVQRYVANMNENVKIFFYRMCNVTLQHVEEYKNCDQKGPKWWEGKKTRTSGSMGAAEVGHNIKSLPMPFLQECLADKSVENKQKPNIFLDHGIDTEGPARDSYLQQVKDEIDLIWTVFGIFIDEYTKQGYIWVRGHRIWLQPKKKEKIQKTETTTEKIYIDLDQEEAETTAWEKPIVEIKESGVLIDKNMPWRCASLDGTVYINGIARWIVEIKCPKGYGCALYPLWPLYYVDQVQNNLHAARQHYSEVTFCDVWIFNPERGGALLCFEYDAHYFWTWYFPRECRFYFEKLLPGFVQKYTAENQRISQPSSVPRMSGWELFNKKIQNNSQDNNNNNNNTNKQKINICTSEKEWESRLHQKRKYNAILVHDNNNKNNNTTATINQTNKTNIPKIPKVNHVPEIFKKIKPV